MNNKRFKKMSINNNFQHSESSAYSERLSDLQNKLKRSPLTIGTVFLVISVLSFLFVPAFDVIRKPHMATVVFPTCADEPNHADCGKGPYLPKWYEYENIVWVAIGFISGCISLYGIIAGLLTETNAYMAMQTKSGGSSEMTSVNIKGFDQAGVFKGKVNFQCIMCGTPRANGQLEGIGFVLILGSIFWGVVLAVVHEGLFTDKASSKIGDDGNMVQSILALVTLLGGIAMIVIAQLNGK